MSIAAVMLFGSWARGDQTGASDTDLLMLTTESGPPRHSMMGNVSLSIYARSDFAARAAAGDLFAWHVLFEGRPIYDPAQRFATLRKQFRLKSDYSAEIGHGIGVAWLIVRFGSRYAASSLAARRAAWAVRTVLIAKTAEAGRPRFAANDLAEFASIDAVPRLINQKRCVGLSHEAISDLAVFLDWAKVPDPGAGARSEEEYRKFFNASGNAVGIKFLDALRSGDALVDYP